MSKISFLQRLGNAIAAFRGRPLLDPTSGQGGIPLTAFWVSMAPWVSRSLYVITKLGVIESIHQRPASADLLAEQLNVDAGNLSRLLIALAGCGLLHMDSRQRFHLTDATRQLLESDDQSLRHWTLLLGESWWEANRGMLDCVRTGNSGFQCVTGSSMWEHYQTHPDQRVVFDAAMNEVTQWQSRAIADVVSLAQAQHIVDIGCGKAALLTELLVRNPHLRGTGLDRQTSGAELQARLDCCGVAERTTMVTGSFFESAEIPADGDVYFIKHVLHDWDDEHARKILAAVANAMPDHARLHVIEGVRGLNRQHDFLLDWLDIEQMVVTANGRERTRQQFMSLFQSAGFRLVDIELTAVADASVLTVVRDPG